MMTVPQPHVPQVPQLPAAPIPPERRREIVARVVADHIATGWRVETQSEYQVVFVGGKPPNHVLHAILSLFTFGMWLPIWLLIALLIKEQRLVYTVDKYGWVACIKR